MSEQQATLQQIKQLVSTLPPALQKKYMPRVMHRHEQLFENLTTFLNEDTRKTYPMSKLCEIMSIRYQTSITSGVLKYHIDKGIRSGIFWRNTHNIHYEYGATAILQVTLVKNQPEEIYREYRNRANIKYYMRVDAFGQTQWVTAGPNNTWMLVPGHIRFVIS